MPRDVNSVKQLSPEETLDILDIDRFRPTLKCDLFIPSYIHSVSVATEFIYSYVLSKFAKDFFHTIHVSGKHAFEDLRKLEKGELAKRENPSVSIAYTLQYDFDDNNLDFNFLSTNKYLRRSQWQRSFFKDPKHGLYIGMDLECMMITYVFRFKLNSRAEQIDLYNRMRKVFRIGCTETDDIDMDFHLDRELITRLASEAGFAVDTNGEVIDSWNFVRYMNSRSQMPILRKFRGINQHKEYFVRMRNLPVHMSFQNQLTVDDGVTTGMHTTDYTIEFEIPVRFPCPRTFQLYNEGLWKHEIKLEKDDSAITLFSMKVYDIPEENSKGWVLYGHSNYIKDKDEKVVKKINIRELFKAPADIKVGTSLDDIIQESIDQFVSPDSFIEIAIYTNDYLNNTNGRLPIRMDWINRDIILPDDTTDSYFYIAVYIDREYVNSRVVDITDANRNRIMMSRNDFDKNMEKALHDGVYEENHIIEKKPLPNSNVPKKARFVIKI